MFSYRLQYEKLLLAIPTPSMMCIYVTMTTTYRCWGLYQLGQRTTVTVATEELQWANTALIIHRMH